MKSKRTGYFGFDVSSEFLSDSLDDFVRYATGRLVVAIGAGNLHSEFYNVARMLAAYGLKNFERQQLEPYIDDKVSNMSWDEFVASLLGLLVMSIGNNTFYNQVHFSIHVAGAWAHRHDKGV